MKKANDIGSRKPQLNGHIEVSRLPRRPEDGGNYWLNSGTGTPELTHGLFKFPAKFHLPVVRWALGVFGRRGSTVLDPFTGSGTVQVEAKSRGIASTGVDIDPLAVLVTRVKTTGIAPAVLEDAQLTLRTTLLEWRASRGIVQDVAGGDISEHDYANDLGSVEVPAIPNINHWFRRYVIVDLARLKREIQLYDAPVEVKEFLLACFAAVVRRVSNADPSPVSGLEVTSHQAVVNARRTISVYDEYLRKLDSEVSAAAQFWHQLGPNREVPATVFNVGAEDLSSIEALRGMRFPLVVTSPPYCRAVEYSRRHRLEHFWLGYVTEAAEHIELTHRYIGRDYVRVGDWSNGDVFGVRSLNKRISQIAKADAHKGRSVHHYFSHMEEVLEGVARNMTPSGTLVLVVGDSVCAGQPVETANYLAALAKQDFAMEYRFRYEIRNHYMQYGLRNGDGIREEHVIVLKRRPRGASGPRA